MERILGYVQGILGSALRLTLATVCAALLNLLLFYIDWDAWEMYKTTDMSAQLAHLHPVLNHLIRETIALTPYWPNSVKLAVVAMTGALAVAALAQMLGIRRLLYDPLSLFYKGLCALGLAMLLAVPVAHYDARLDSWQAYAMLLAPGMFFALYHAMRAAACLLPDLSELFAARR